MALAELSTSVVIDEEEYSLLSSPQETSQLVQIEKEHILGQVDLEVAKC